MLPLLLALAVALQLHAVWARQHRLASAYATHGVTPDAKQAPKRPSLSLAALFS